MFRTHVRYLPVVLLALLLSACGGDLGGSPGKPNPNADQVFPAVQAPDMPPDFGGDGSAPKNVPPLPIEVPESFPVFTAQDKVVEYVQTMAEIHVAVTKNRQFHEVAPTKLVTAITGAMSCPTVPNQTSPLRQVGDTAKNTKAGKAMVIASCYKGGKRSIFIAPYRLYETKRKALNRQVVEEKILRVMQEYLAGLTQDKVGHYDRLYVACAGGRMVGGLRDKSYITSQYAYNLLVSSGDTSEYAKVFRTARDEGNCPPKLLGHTS